MKTTGFTPLLTALILFAFAAGAIAAGPAPLQIKIVSTTIVPGGYTAISFTGGTPPYTVANSRTDVAALSCNQPVTSCTATGKAVGITGLVVKDSKGVTSRADLTVAKPAPMPSTPNSASINLMNQIQQTQQKQQDEQLNRLAEQRKNAEIQHDHEPLNKMKDAVQKTETPAKKQSPVDQYIRN